MSILTKLNPRKALNKAFLKVKANRTEIELFKVNLIKLLDGIDESESEEFHKNIIADFLKNTYYGANHYINTKGRNDLVIHNTNSASGTVGVIVEAKKPTNKAEMIRVDNINSKAFQELVLYFLRERITAKNLEIKHLVVTNIYEWFIFDANLFEKEFAQNKHLVEQFIDFEEGRLSGKTTDFFYKKIAEPAIAAITHEVAFTHFNIRDYEKPLRNADKKDDNILIALYKLMSPEHLLKLPFANDSNSLDKSFYTELLHIIGLTETKEGGKKLIQRKKEGERNAGSLIESAIFQLDNLDKISRLEKPSQFGETNQERLFNVALELSITWINRILFLKLLEAQLIKYHKGDTTFAFLNTDRVQNFDDLNNLFFSVLARKPQERNDTVKKHFANVPYLNSSLFEPTEIEHSCLFISQLRDGQLPLLSSTVIKDNIGNKRSGKLVIIEYIFEFLNAYDFASEGSEDIQEDNKRLINASVLGLIFEKINGYKDGSFFTPGFITMYMCRETIRRAVVQKFNETKGWDCADLTQLYDKIDDRKEANAIVNSLKICDPAVGSGHFLVSALNEMIAIKSDLKILLDRDGKRLKEYSIEVENDELIVTDDEGELFGYNPRNKESQRIQETLFHEKQTIIENCLFGVDINPNSVKICRLRLWIELLKNAYYKAPEYSELETLPNIDINIKCGNSLISRYALDADIKKALKRSKWSIDSYRLAIMTYRNAQSKEEKHAMERMINGIKNDFESEIATNDKRLSKLNTTKGDLLTLTTQTTLFEKTKTEKATWNKQVKMLTDTMTQLENEIEEIRSNKIYENAFEWRFEFPEVLNDDGDFMGFDVVIGNPPYIRAEELGEFRNYLKDRFSVFAPAGDIFSYFYERSYSILRNKGKFCFINNTYDKTTAGKILRKFVQDNFSIEQYIDFTSVIVFEEATTYPVILLASKSIAKEHSLNFLKIESLNQNKETIFLNDNFINMSQDSLNFEAWNFKNKLEIGILQKVNSHKKIIDNYGKSYRGIITGLNEAFILESKMSDATVLEPVYDGKDIKKWCAPNPIKWIIAFESKSTTQKVGQHNEACAKKLMVEFYPEIFDHLNQFEEKAKKRYDKGEFWWELRNCAYYELFAKPKIIFPNLQNSNKFAFDDTGTYLNAPSVFLPTNDKTLLGILNSKLIWYFLTSICVIRSGGYIEVKPQYFEQIPIAEISDEKSNQIVEKVEQILSLKKQAPNADITALESEIDRLVYQLYGLTEEEIKIVENS